jgi:hypothetical protein
VSRIIEEYSDFDSRKRNLANRDKVWKLEKEKYFEENKSEYSDLVRCVFIKYSDLHKEIDDYFNQVCRKFPDFGKFAETALYFAFVRKMEEKYFNVEFIPKLCNNLTIDEIKIKKLMYLFVFSFFHILFIILRIFIKFGSISSSFHQLF